MSAEGILSSQGEVIIWGPMEASRTIAFPIMGGIIIEKMIVVHCIPTDSAVDVYAFDGGDQAIQILECRLNEPYLSAGKRIHRIGWQETLNAEVWNNGTDNARLIVRHIPGEFAQSLN
jgi:hypothetical protein